jgi:hypothetical protein
MSKYLSQVELRLLTGGAETAEAQADYLRTYYGIEPFVVGGRVLVYQEAAIRAQLTPRQDRSNVVVNAEVFHAAKARKSR